MKRNILAITCAVLMVSCSSPEQRVISQAGENGSELQKVLDYFKTDSCKERYEAAKFLIRNIGGNFSLDTTSLSLYRPYLTTACSLFVNYEDNHELLKKNIDSTWNVYKQNNALGTTYDNYSYDYKSIKATYLIKDIELAYDVWNKNPFNSKANFDEFCEYVLPYRRKNGYSIENWREYFFSRKKDHFSKHQLNSLIKSCDTLLYDFREFKHNRFLLSDYPILKVNDFEQLKRGNCGHKCWYNSMLFSSLGIACAIDFVPAWGNRPNGHSWNVIVENGKSYAFEPFWDTERWKYKRIYNNVSWDDQWGKFRLPKVYRHTYSNHFKGPITDTRVESFNIPDLFRNCKKIDVSNEYFEAQDIEIEIEQKMPEDVYYCYLCVFGNQKWHPVQWGEIKGKSVLFKGMGKDIVYLPCFYKRGELISAAEPFLLSADGNVKKITPNGMMNSTIHVNRFTIQNPNWGKGLNYLKGSRIETSNESKFSSKQSVAIIPDTMLYELNIQYLNLPAANRFVRMVFPTDSISISELCFFTRNNDGGLDQLTGKLIGSQNLDQKEIGKAFDNLSTTSFKHSALNGKVESNNNSKWIGLDLSSEKRIDAFGYIPTTSCCLYDKTEFELFYWKDGWESIMKKQGNGKALEFSNVPENALLMLKNKSWSVHGSERIFIYQNGEQKWY